MRAVRVGYDPDWGNQAWLEIPPRLAGHYRNLFRVGWRIAREQRPALSPSGADGVYRNERFKLHYDRGAREYRHRSLECEWLQDAYNPVDRTVRAHHHRCADLPLNPGGDEYSRFDCSAMALAAP